MLFDSIEHKFLPIPFTVLTLCGSWSPQNWPASKKRIYKVYTISITSLAIILLIEVLVKIALTRDTDEFNLENVFAFLAICAGMLKHILVVYDRKKILKVIRYCTHEEEWHKPQNSVETTVKLKIQNETRTLSVLYAMFVVIAVSLRAMLPVIDAATVIVLPLDAWYPYTIGNFFLFAVTYFHQYICGILMSCMHIASETLFVSLMIQIKYQLIILALRLKNLKRIDNLEINKQSKTNNSPDLKHIIMHNINSHEKIYRSGNDLQAAFSKVSIGQTFFLIPNLILNAYFLSVYTDRLSVKYFMTFFFFLVPLMQIYMFCWYGNEIILGCSDISYALYESDWISLNKSTRKLLLPIFMRSTQPIVIATAAIIPYDVNSFIKIMKTTYTAFNLLQHTVRE